MVIKLIAKTFLTKNSFHLQIVMKLLKCLCAEQERKGACLMLNKYQRKYCSLVSVCQRQIGSEQVFWHCTCESHNAQAFDIFAPRRGRESKESRGEQRKLVFLHDCERPGASSQSRTSFHNHTSFQSKQYLENY